MKIRFTLAFVLFLFCLNPVRAQNYLGFQLNSVYGFESDHLKIFNNDLELHASYGYQFFAFYSYRFKKQKLEPKFALGWKYLQFEGEFDEQAIFGNTYKLSILSGLDYRVHKKWIVGLDFIIENNLDFELFRAANSDLLRYNIQPRISYKLSKKCMASLGFSKVLYPRVNHFLIANPSNQFNLGLAYKPFKL